MKLSMQWLKKILPITDTAEEISNLLTFAGVEVEGIEVLGKNFENIVVGKILKIEKHPNADRLSLCQVDVGIETLQIICGAQNIFEDALVPVAKIGAILPGDFKIKKAKMRQVESFGMICSKVELGLAKESDGVYILDDNLKIGQPIQEALELDDEILEIAITPNRGDCLSMFGLAREISLLKRLDFSKGQADVPDYSKGKWNVHVDSWENCCLYSGIVIENIKVGESPSWLKNLLEKMGQRSINNIVDITNYVLLEIGQPLHAFDLNQINGNSIKVRQAQPGEIFYGLDQGEYHLQDQLVISDESSVLALAGVMGGAKSQVCESTQNIFLESAYFHPDIVRKSAKSTKILTESSYRFERTVDIEKVLVAQQRAVELILQMCPSAIVKEQTVVDHRDQWYQRPQNEFDREYRANSVVVRKSKIHSLLGFNVDANEIERILKFLSIDISYKNDAWTLIPPSSRTDLRMEVDYIEEIARVVGYEKIPSVSLPAYISTDKKDYVFHKHRYQLKQLMIHQGFQEARNLSFIGEKLLKNFDELSENLCITIANPLSEDHKIMRPSLLPGLLQNLIFNIRKNTGRQNIFEIGKTFWVSDTNQFKEEWSLSAVASGLYLDDGYTKESKCFDFYVIKGIIEHINEHMGLGDISYQVSDLSYLHPGIQAELFHKEKGIGVLGQIHPSISQKMGFKDKIYYFSLNINYFKDDQNDVKKYIPLNLFPSVDRDFSIVVPEQIPAEDIRQFLKNDDDQMIEEVQLFDYYKGDRIRQDQKSLAFRIRYRSKDTTLTDEKVDLHLKCLTAKVIQHFKCDFQ